MKLKAATLLAVILGITAPCAQICKDAGSTHCSYGPRQKQCVVGDESGRDEVRSRVYYMKKKLEDNPLPGGEDGDGEPFPEDCEADKEACESEKAKLDSKLKDCEDKRIASAFSFNSTVCAVTPERRSALVAILTDLQLLGANIVFYP
ncbi:hypothetical protein TSTA_018900 [Talaromyces stipitatus ATCC 10500]|uniref:Uncharacterized protein n=1 Tax=Talaromyces stipitatus (strain ATCC 10500 / CBS 375.48 / QM 6759 / NRRL 1006) TaxID=441959 RepID=B8MH10_TALSN|nr:uncharacterized protein TSTA_018900 [Talaromyces stipitatus ATCC 10500]EED16824.1 hypothetical protein TSTA_018900 [Talaromyces stipitatus ATCC 10500]